MNGTEFARISGSYSTAFIGTYQVLNQSTTNNNTTFRLYGYFYYGGGTQVSSATNGGFYLDGTYIHSSHYTFNPGYHLLGTKDIVVSHNNDGSFPGKYVGISANSWHMSGSAGGNIYAGKINRYPVLNNGSNFTDEGNPVYNITSYNSFPLRIKLEAGGNPQLITRNVSTSTNGNYTLILTESERNILRKLCSNSNTLNVTETVCAMDGNTELSASYKFYTMAIVNANPTFDNFEFEDVNPTTVSLTGNSQNVIQGYSNVKATIPVEFIAKANKSATMLKYSFISGDKQKDITYKEDQETSNIIDNVKSGVFNVYAIDSRNNSTLVTKNAEKTIAYNPVIKNNIIVSRENGISQITKLSVKGTVDLVNFGNVTNSIKESKFRYKISSLSEWSDYKNIKLTVGENGDFIFDDYILGDTDDGFSIENSYNIEVMVKDELSTATFTANLTSGIPNIALHKNGVGIMGKYDTTEGGLLQIESKNIFKYSTSEIDTGYKWTDGKKIYKRTYTGSLTSPINHGLSNFNIINFNAHYVSGSGAIIPLPSIRTSAEYNVGMYVNSTQIIFERTTATGTAYVTLEYTKND
jgi:hypothetical protein